MSIKATSWVYEHSPYTLAARLVHLALADVTNDDYDNRLWLSQGKIAEKARVSRATVNKVIAQMVADGFLELDEEARGQRPAVYRFLMPSAISCQKSDRSEGVSCQIQDGLLSNPGICTSSLTQRNSTHTRDDEATKGKGKDYRFSDVWEVWPRRRGLRTGKAKALEQWKKLSYADKTVAFKAVQAFAATSPEFPPDLFRWLRDRGWLDWADGENAASAPRAGGRWVTLQTDDGPVRCNTAHLGPDEEFDTMLGARGAYRVHVNRVTGDRHGYSEYDPEDPATWYQGAQ